MSLTAMGQMMEAVNLFFTEIEKGIRDFELMEDILFGESA